MSMRVLLLWLWHLFCLVFSWEKSHCDWLFVWLPTFLRDSREGRRAAKQLFTCKELTARVSDLQFRQFQTASSQEVNAEAAMEEASMKCGPGKLLLYNINCFHKTNLFNMLKFTWFNLQQHNLLLWAVPFRSDRSQSSASISPLHDITDLLVAPHPGLLAVSSNLSIPSTQILTVPPLNMSKPSQSGILPFCVLYSSLIQIVKIFPLNLDQCLPLLVTR